MIRATVLGAAVLGLTSQLAGQQPAPPPPPAPAAVPRWFRRRRPAHFAICWSSMPLPLT